MGSKSARNPGHYRLFVSTRTRPGQMQKFRDCPGHSGTLGNYAFHSGLGSEGPLSIIDRWVHWARIFIIMHRLADTLEAAQQAI